MTHLLRYIYSRGPHSFSQCTSVEIGWCFFEHCSQPVKFIQSAQNPFVFNQTDTSYFDCGGPAIYLGTQGTATIARCCGVRCVGGIFQFVRYEMNKQSRCETALVAVVDCGCDRGSQATIMFRLGTHVLTEYNATECRLKEMGAAFCFEPDDGTISNTLVANCSGPGVVYLGHYSSAQPSASINVTRLSAVDTRSRVLGIANVLQLLIGDSTFRGCGTIAISVTSNITAVAFDNCLFDGAYSTGGMAVPDMGNARTGVSDIQEIDLIQFTCHNLTQAFTTLKSIRTHYRAICLFVLQ